MSTEDLGSFPRAVMKYDLNSRCPNCGSQIKSIGNALFSLTEKNSDQTYLPLICGSCGADIMHPNKQGVKTSQ